MAGINDYSNTPSLNTTINTIDVDEGCNPANINDAIRQLMADIADVDDGVVPLQTPDINGGTIDGAVIGGTTAAAGTFTTVTATSFFGDGSNLTGITTDATAIKDADEDTKIQTEETADEDKLRFDTAGIERAVMDSNGLFFTTNGGFVAHHNDIANDMSLTNQNMMLVGSVTVSGTLTVNTGSTVVVI